MSEVPAIEDLTVREADVEAPDIGAAPSGGDASASSLLAIANVLLKRRRWIVTCALLVGLIMALAGVLAPARYTVRTAFVPNGGGSALAAFAGLAAQLGVPLPTDDASQSPAFYAELVRSREIHDQVAASRYPVPGGEGEATLLDLYEIEGDTDAHRLEEAHERLARDARVSVDRRTGIVRLAVTSPWPGMSAALAGDMLDRLGDFDLETRRSRASAERGFIGERLVEAEQELRAAETRQQRFLDQNRRYQNSARLVFEYERLDRRVSLQQQLYTSLAQAHEQAKIEEVRNTPVLSVVQRPVEPAEPDSRYLILRLALGLVLGALIGVVAAFGRELLLGARRTNSSECREFDALWAQARTELGGLFRPLRAFRPRRTG